MKSIGPCDKAGVEGIEVFGDADGPDGAFSGADVPLLALLTEPNAGISVACGGGDGLTELSLVCDCGIGADGLLKFGLSANSSGLRSPNLLSRSGDLLLLLIMSRLESK